MEKVWVLKRIEEIGVIPVVRAASAEEAIAVAEVIGEGGIPILEITLTVPGAVAVIAKLSKRYGDKVLVGGGTVLDAESARDCIAAGAQFIVSPSLNIPTIDLCKRQRIAVFPGALTPTEVVSAWQAGADAVKVFPCSAVGVGADLVNTKAINSGARESVVAAARGYVTAVREARRPLIDSQ